MPREGFVEKTYLKCLRHDQWGPLPDNLIDVSDLQEKVCFEHVHARRSEWQCVDDSEAAPYLPDLNTRKVALGIQEIHTVELSRFDSESLNKHMSLKYGFVINTGGSVWGLDFAPKRPSVDTEPLIQYLAVAGYRGTENEHHTYIETQTGYKNCVQIWRCQTSIHAEETDPVLDLCLLHDYGTVSQLKWCPYGVYEEETTSQQETDLPKLGILTIACGDSSVRTIVVPHPKAVRKAFDVSDPTKTVFLRIEKSRCTFSLPRTHPTNFAWGGHKKLAVSYTFGNVALWNMETALADEVSHLSNHHLTWNVLVDDATIRGLTWDSLREPTYVAAVGLSGMLNVIDIQDPSLQMTISRIRGSLFTAAWSDMLDELFFVDADYSVRSISMVTTEIGVGSKLTETRSIIWDWATSDQHIFALVTTADGWVLGVNPLSRRKKRGNTVQSPVYKLIYDKSSETLRFVDGIPPESWESLKKKIPEWNAFVEPTIALQRAAWNPNQKTGAWIATAGAAGLCRVEFIGEDVQWG